jgi:hypothetical protein
MTDDEEYSRAPTGTHTPNPHATPGLATQTSFPSAPSAEQTRGLLATAFDSPLKGVKIIIIHVKDTLSDGPLVGDQILTELEEGEQELQECGKGLGCVFEISKSGGSYWF